MVVEQRYLPYILRESHRQLSAGVDISEQYVANGIGGFASAKPYVQYGGYVRLLPGQRQRTSGEEGEHYGLARLQQGFQQRALHIGQVEIGTAGAFAAHFGRFAECGYDNVCTGGCFQGFVQQFLVRTVVPVQGAAEHGGAFFVGGVADEVAAFGVCDVHFAGHHLFQSLIQGRIVVEAGGYAPCAGHIAACVAQGTDNGYGSFFFQREQRLGQRAGM